MFVYLYENQFCNMLLFQGLKTINSKKTLINDVT